MFKGKPSIDNLDQYLARKEFDQALAVLAEEARRRPDNASLRLRQAEVMVMAGDVPAAVEVYRGLAEEYIKQGFFARAIAVTNKILRIDPERTAVTNELAQLIVAQQEADREAHARLQQVAARTEPEASAPEVEPQPVGGDVEPSEAIDEAVIEIEVEEPEGPVEAPVQGMRTPEEEERERDASRFFAAFPPAALEELLSVTAVRSFSEGEALVREGDEGASLFLIEEGHVEVLTSDPGGRDLILARLGPGDFFGEVSVLTGRPRTATIIAREPVTAIEIQRGLLNGILERHPDVETVLRDFYERRAKATAATMLARLRGEGG